MYLQLNGSVKEPNKFHNYETEKITRKASGVAEYIELFGSFIRNCHAWCISERPPMYASSCTTIPGERTEQLDIIAGFQPHHWFYEWFSSTENVRRYMRRAWRSRVEEPNNTLQ